MFNTLRDLKITEGVFLLGRLPQTSYSSSTPLLLPCAVELLDDGAGPSDRESSVSFGTLGEDQMSIAAMESRLFPLERKMRLSFTLWC